MSMNRTCPISSAISFLTSAAIWVHMEMPDATILLGLLPRVESKVRIRALSAPAISSE